jgi:hypothetical protein
MPVSQKASQPKPMHDPVALPEQDPPSIPFRDPPGDPTYEPTWPVIEPTPNPASDPPPEIPGDPPLARLRHLRFLAGEPYPIRLSGLGIASGSFAKVAWATDTTVP